MKKSPLIPLLFLATLFVAQLSAREPDTILNLWPSEPPGEAMNVGDETDFTKPTDKLIAGRRIIKLGNVKTPQIHVFRPEKTMNTGASVVICPGGGFSILAWDLEGTEVADYFNSLGVTAIVLKYRVPTREQSPAWLAPTQDAQRAIRLVRHHAENWEIDPDRVGILGFSAGGKTAGMASFTDKAYYEATDEADKLDFMPNFSALIYAAWLVNKAGDDIADECSITDKTPPVFMAHAYDDFVPAEGPLLLGKVLKREGIPFDLHLYSEGGHGYGLRITGQPVTTWHHRLADWLEVNGWIGKRD